MKLFVTYIIGMIATWIFMIVMMVDRVSTHGAENCYPDLSEMCFISFLAGLIWPCTWLMILLMGIGPLFIKFLAGV